MFHVKHLEGKEGEVDVSRETFGEKKGEVFYMERSKKRKDVNVSRETFGEKGGEVFYMKCSEEKERSRCFT